jgi:hypothetical protein
MLYGGTLSRLPDLPVSSIGRLELLPVDLGTMMVMQSCENLVISPRVPNSHIIPSSTTDPMFSALKTHYATLKART